MLEMTVKVLKSCKTVNQSVNLMVFLTMIIVIIVAVIVNFV